MKPVNLLPAGERRQVAAAVPRNAATAVVAGLAVVLLALVAVVLTKNDIASKRTEIAQAKSEQAQATQRSAGLKAFGDFRTVKETRVRSVTQLATTRFDWERFMRELALVLPGNVWLTEADSAGAGTSGGTASQPASPATGADTAPSGATTVSLKGCAKTQGSVAETMARLRNMHDVDDVSLDESQRSTDTANSSSAPAADSSGGGGGCGDRYAFSATVEFAAPSASSDTGQHKVPSKLGGGA